MNSKTVTPERMLEEDLAEKMLESKMVEMQQLIEYLDKLHQTIQNSSRKLNDFDLNSAHDSPLNMDEKTVNAQEDLKAGTFDSPAGFNEQMTIMNNEDQKQANNDLLHSIQRNKCRISQAVEISRTIH